MEMWPPPDLGVFPTKAFQDLINIGRVASCLDKTATEPQILDLRPNEVRP